MSCSLPSADYSGGAWGQFEQCADGSTSAAAGAEFEYLAEQNQRDNRRRGFEINCRRDPSCRETTRERSREQGRDQAVDICDAGADRDQREHIG